MSVLVVSFAAYTLAIVAVGLLAGRGKQETDEDYFLGGRKLGPWVAALSASASSESAWVTLGLVGWAYASGVSAFWIIPGCLIGYTFNWLVIAPRLRDRSVEVGALTTPDFLSMSFTERLPILRLLAVAIILVAMFAYTGAQFAAAGKAFSFLFDGVNHAVGVWIGVAIVLAYVILGGFKAACWTDFVQGLLMAAALIGVPLFALVSFGGWDETIGTLSGVVTEDGANAGLTEWIPEGAKSGTSAMLGFLFGSGALGINLGYPGQPHVLARFMALRKRSDALIGGVVSVTWAGLVFAGAVTLGLVARAMIASGDLPAATGEALSGDSELALLVVIRDVIPSKIIAGGMLAAILAAICSTADSMLVVAASSAANDVYSRLIDDKRSRRHTMINRGTVLALGVGAGMSVRNPDVNVFSLVLTYGWAVLGASLAPALTLLLLWRGVRYAGVIVACATGFGVSIWWEASGAAKETGFYNLTVAAVLATGLCVLVSLLLRGDKRQAPIWARD